MLLNPPLQQLYDLPRTFLRGSNVFQEIMVAIAAGLELSAQSSNTLINQTTFDNATAGWIDVWAALAGLLRRSSESDGVFHDRIQTMLLAARDSPIAIGLWLEQVEHVVGSVAENLPNVGYSVQVPATLSVSRLQEIVKDLAYVRPAGVPFNFGGRSGGTYLNTVNYLGATAPSPNVLAESQSPGLPIASADYTQTFRTARTGFVGGRVTGSYLSKGLSPGKTFLGTVNYYGLRAVSTQVPIPVITPIQITGVFPWVGGRVTGAYLAKTSPKNVAAIPYATNNQQSLIPDLLFTDPTLNPPA